MFNDVLGRYQAVSAHDGTGTGIGNVVNDLIDERARKFVMTGRARTQLLVEYITAVERGVYRLPANTPAFAAHKAMTVEEVYAPGKWNSHLSDDVAAFALAHNAADRQAPPAAGEGVPRTSYVSRSQRELTYGPGEPALLAVGEVRMVEEEMNPCSMACAEPSLVGCHMGCDAGRVANTSTTITFPRGNMESP